MHASIKDEMNSGLRTVSAVFVALLLISSSMPAAAQEASEGEASAQVTVTAEAGSEGGDAEATAEADTSESTAASATETSEEAEEEETAIESAEENAENPARPTEPYVASAEPSVEEPDEEEPEVEAPPPAWGLDVGGVQFRPGLNIWTRGELRGNSYLGNAAGADAYGQVFTRMRVQLDAKWEILRGFIQIQDARAWGITPFNLFGETAGPTTGVHQGFLEVGEAGTWLRVGRQEIIYGGQRMLGGLNWTSVARAFDAIRGHATVGLGEAGKLEFDLHGAMLNYPGVVPGTTDAMGGAVRTEGDFIAGGYAQWNQSAALNLGAFVYFRHDGPSVANTDRDQNLATFTLRGTGNVDGVLRYEAEAFIQAGGTEDNDHLAAALIGEVNYKLKDVAWTPEFGIGGTFATGNSPDGDWQAFNDHYPTNHLIYGLIDLFGLRNQTHGYLRFQLTPDPGRFTFFGYGRLFRWTEPSDTWTNLARGTVSAMASTDDFAGGEFDLDFRWTPIDHLSMWFGYSVFIPGQGVLNRRGDDEEMHFGYAMLQLNL